MPPIWVVFPIAMAAGAVHFAVVAFVARTHGKPLPMLGWLRWVSPMQRRLTLLALVWEVGSLSVLLWSIEPGHELSSTVRFARGLGNLLAWGTLIWVGVSVLRKRGRERADGG